MEAATKQGFLRGGLGALREVDAAGGLGTYRLPPDSPYRRLIIAVILVAIEDARTGGPRTGCSTDSDGLRAKVRRMVQARDWILSARREELFDFDRLCEELDLDPQTVKRREQSTWGPLPEECAGHRRARARMVHSLTRKMGA